MYMEKSDLATGGNTSVEFIPKFGVHTWQLRIISNDTAAMNLVIQTIDEDDDAVHITKPDGNTVPFVNTGQGGHSDSDFGTDGELEITLDSTNPILKVTISGASATATVKCKAYRTLEDIATGGYTDITPDE